MRAIQRKASLVSFLRIFMINENLNNVNFQEFFVNLLSSLSLREQEVLKKRYQLTSDLDRKHTLKQIGDDYGITRERVRQIEKEAILKLIETASNKNYQDQVSVLRDNLVHFIERKGGVVSQDDLIKEHALAKYDFDFLHLNSFLFVLDQLIQEVERNDESDDFYSFWQLNVIDSSNVNDFIERLVANLDERNSIVMEEELFEILEKKLLTEIEKVYLDSFIKKHSDLTYRELLVSFLTITKQVEKNILNHWGLATWSKIRPKKLGDKIGLVFQKNNQPLHFREVAEHINSAGFDKKRICAATVHNELIANQEYVLIGRGIYALKDWGFTPGTVSDIMITIMKEKQQPMTKEEIYQEVLKQRKVNPSTIYLSLINKKRFKKLDSGLFDLQ